MDENHARINQHIIPRQSCQHRCDIVGIDTVSVAVVLTFLWPVLCGYRRLLTMILRRKWSKFNDTLRGRNEDIVKEWKHKMNQIKKVALFTKSINDKYAFLAENLDDSILSTWDTDGVFFCVDNCATCIICNDKSLFVGDFQTMYLRSSHF